VVAERVEMIVGHAGVAVAGDREQPVAVPAREPLAQRAAVVRRHRGQDEQSRHPHRKIDRGGSEQSADRQQVTTALGPLLDVRDGHPGIVPDPVGRRAADPRCPVVPRRRPVCDHVRMREDGR
jgi:hypothetical protein